jgi:hypothetical protein
MRITNAGNVGIGTTAPQTKLHVAGSVMLGNGAESCGSTYAGAIRYNTSNLSVEFCNGTGWLVLNSGTTSNTTNVSSITNTSGGITITPLAASNVQIASTVASTSPTTGALVVNGGVGVSGALYASGNISSSGTVSATNSIVSPQIYGSTAPNGEIKIDGTSDATKGSVLLNSAGGKVGIGTTTPVAKLDVAGEIKLGNTASTCNGTNEGQQRYNSSSKNMEFCNGTAWKSMTAPAYETLTTNAVYSSTHETWSYSAWATCSAGYTLRVAGLIKNFAGTAANYHYCSCDQSGNSVRAGALGSVNANFYCQCQAFCTSN